MKRLILIVPTALMTLTSSAFAGQCIDERISNKVHEASVRSRPGMKEKELWRLAKGAVVSYCGNAKLDARSPPIEWHFISFKSTEEPWSHDGWVSSRILEPTEVQPQHTLSEGRAVAGLGAAATPALDEHQRQWIALTDTASTAYGAISSHGCQPELKTCYTAISYPNKDGGMTMVRFQEDADGTLVSRDVCKINKNLDVRNCIDFDTQAASKEMKNEHGNWIGIN